MYCISKDCKNTEFEYPNKKFVHVPLRADRRNAWIRAVGRDPSKYKLTTLLHICEDHFNLESDMVNYMKYRLAGGKITMKKYAVPHLKLSDVNNAESVTVDQVIQQQPEDELPRNGTKRKRSVTPSEVCRTCLTTGDLKSLYDEGSTQDRVNEMLMTCTSVKYDITDGLPQNICTDCLDELTRCYKFALKCQESDAKLRISSQKDVEQNDLTINSEPKITAPQKDAPIISAKIEKDLDPELVSIQNRSNREQKYATTTSLQDPPEMPNEFNPEFVVVKQEIVETVSDTVLTANEMSTINQCIDHIKLEHFGGGSVEEEPSKTEDEKPYSCTVCSQAFADQTLWTEHARSHVQTYQCLICESLFATKRLLNKHMHIHNRRKHLCCPVCDTLFHFKTSVESHMLKHEDEKTFRCVICRMTLNCGVKDFVAHIRTHHPDDQYYCTICHCYANYLSLDE